MNKALLTDACAYDSLFIQKMIISLPQQQIRKGKAIKYKKNGKKNTTLTINNNNTL